MRAIQVTWILSLLLLFSCGSLSGLQAQTVSSTDPLTQAQIENQRAQATYYHRQADRRGFWRNLREYGGSIGAAVAAVVAIISFGLNYRATLRSRTDAKFYEALNLFAESRNPSVRSSAAGLLEQMGSTRKRFYQTAFDQLAVALLAEREDNTRNAIRTAFSRLVELDPAAALSKLKATNRNLRDALAEAFCRFCVVRSVKKIEMIPDSVWEEAEEATSYNRDALTGLVQLVPDDNIAAKWSAAARTYRTRGNSDKDDCLASTRSDLSDGAERLRSNIRSLSESLILLDGKAGQNSSSRSKATKSFALAFLVGATFRDLQGGKISRSIVCGADFTAANLTRAVLLDSDLSTANFGNAKLCQTECTGINFVGAVLKQADLTGAKFYNSDLTDADLTATRFRNTSIAPDAFERTEWWKADFRYQRDLLKAIHAKYKKDLPDLEGLYVRGEIHRSVLDFIGKITEERL